ncbi:MAG: TRAP transporter permease [Rhodospirillaceae bacterium]
MNVSNVTSSLDQKLTDSSWLKIVAAVIALAHLYLNSFSSLSDLWASLLHFGLMGLLVSFALAEKKASGGQFGKLPKFFLGGIILFASLYLIMSEDAFYNRGQNFNKWDWTFSILAVVGALELARRTTGWVIPILAVLALTYATFWGRFVTGVFHFPGLTWETMLYRATYGGDGMFGTIARISWTYVFMFILFGTMLLKSGASDMILGLARRAAARFVGGPGLVAVFSSGLMGSVSGSAIGNTVSTGVVTIPLMRQSGFPARTAAGIEAASSTGGQLMPPVMGAGAFLMAAYTGENYMTIIGVAALPALLYFLSVAFQVRCVALRLGLNTNLSKHEDTEFSQDWPVLIPIAILVGLLITGFTPTWSAGMASVACIICARFGRRPMGLKDVIDGLAQASVTAAPIAVLLIAVGLVIMAVTTTGLGPTVSQMIINWSGGSLVLTLILVALASLILGLGLPVTAAYVVLAPLAAPALADLILQAKLIEALMGEHSMKVPA